MGDYHIHIPGISGIPCSGWHHQVRNLEATISINHNWTNAFCLCNMWQHLQHELQLVEQELQDCAAMDGWQQHCQVRSPSSVR